MEVIARAVFMLVTLSFAFSFSHLESKDVYSSFDVRKVVIHNRGFGDSVLVGKAWIRLQSSKSFRKRIRRRRAYSYCRGEIDPCISLLLCGDVELNPGPATHTKITRSVARDEVPDFSEILLRLERKFDDGQESLIKNQTQMLDRLAIIEREIETFKLDLECLKKQQTVLEERVNVLGETVGMNFDHCKDLQFLMDRHEQYSRKSSVRIRGVSEENNEDLESVTLNILQKEIGVVVTQNEIDIVHRVGRRQENRPRPILIKFLSHKTKEKVMRAKKKATTVKINEDLAPGIKRILDEVSSNRRFLNIDSVWTIDGRIKFRFVNNPRTFEIRSYADYHNLFNAKQ